MNGGEVIATVNVHTLVWIKCRDEDGLECSIYVERSNVSRSVSEGDTLRWHSTHAYWTPYDSKGKPIGNVFDIPLRRIAVAGAHEPGKLQPSRKEQRA